jgi:hypothetical protein
MVHTNPVVTGKIVSTFKTLCTLTFFILGLVITFSISDSYATNTICYLVATMLSYILYYRMLYHCDRTTHRQRIIIYDTLIMHLIFTTVFVVMYYAKEYVVFGISSLWLILLYQFFVIFLMIRPCNAVVKQFSHNLHVYDEEDQTTNYVTTADM